MKKLTAIVLCVAMLLMSVSVFADDAAGEITIALITNTTGDYAQYGIPVHNAAMLYINQLNAAGRYRRQDRQGARVRRQGRRHRDRQRL